MAVRNDGYDILLNGKGYILARQNSLNLGGRGWEVDGFAGSVARTTDEGAQYGGLPPQIEIPIAWLSTHLGYGDAQFAIKDRYHWGQNIDGRFYQQVTPAPKMHYIVVPNETGDITCFAEFLSRLYFGIGPKVGYLDTSGNVTVIDLGGTSDVTDMIVFDNTLVIARGFNEPIVTIDVKENISESSDVYAKFFTLWEENLYANLSPHEVACVETRTDPLLLANWSALYHIGDESSVITSLCALGELVYVGKESGLHALDVSWSSPPLTPEMEAYRSSYNCKNMAPWHGLLIVPHLRGLLAYRDMGDSGFSLTPIGPSRDITRENPIRGRITAVAGDDRWLYITLLSSDGDTFLLAGKTARAEDTEIIAWHPLNHIDETECHAMHLSGLWDNPRLFFGLSGGTLGYIILPRDMDNPVRDTNCRYETSSGTSATGTIYYPSFSFAAPDNIKVWKSIDVIAENIFYDQYLEVFCRVDKTIWTSVGTVRFAPKTTIDLTSLPPGREIEVRVDFHQYSKTFPIILRGLVLRAVERPMVTETIRAAIRCADHLPKRTTGFCPRTGAEILQELKALAEHPYPVELVDVIGMRRTVVVIPPVKEQIEYDQQGEMPREVIASVTMAVIEIPMEIWRRFTLGVGVFGGLEVPLSVPITISGGYSVPYTISVDEEQRLRISIFGPFSTLTIENQTTGETLSLAESLDADEMLFIDLLQAEEVVFDQDGNNRLSTISPDSDLDTFHLAKGDNSLLVTGTGEGPSSAIYIEVKENG